MAGIAQNKPTRKRDTILNAKQKICIEFFYNPVSDTFNKRIESMLKSGYSKNYARGASHLLFDNELFIKGAEDYKARLNAKTAVSKEYIQNEHERLAKLAEAKGDLPTATRNKELLGKTIAVYTENINTGDLKVPIPASAEDAKRKSEAKRMKLKLA